MATHRDPENALLEMNRKLRMRDRGWLSLLSGWILSYIIEWLIYLQILPAEAILVSYVVIVSFGIFGAYNLAESKGYVGRYGAWYLLLGLPFLIWFMLARDRWNISIKPAQSGDNPVV